MDQAFEVEIADGITWVRFSRKPVIAEIVAALEEVARRDGPTDRIWDFTPGIDLGGNMLRQVSEHSRRILPMAARVAFVAPDALSFGLSRAYTVYREQGDLDLQVFGTVDEALAWLRDGDGSAGS